MCPLWLEAALSVHTMFLMERRSSPNALNSCCKNSVTMQLHTTAWLVYITNPEMQMTDSAKKTTHCSPMCWQLTNSEEHHLPRQLTDWLQCAFCTKLHLQNTRQNTIKQHSLSVLKFVYCSASSEALSLQMYRTGINNASLQSALPPMKPAPILMNNGLHVSKSQVWLQTCLSLHDVCHSMSLHVLKAEKESSCSHWTASEHVPYYQSCFIFHNICRTLHL
jgi:hypothetical protein